MAKHKNYVYYEADCTMSLINPFTDLETEEPGMASFNSKALKVVHIVVLVKMRDIEECPAKSQILGNTMSL